MHPILFQIGSFTVYTYGFFLACAVLVVGWLLIPQVAQLKVSKEKLYDLIFVIVLFAILGARAFFVFLNWHHFLAHPLEIIMFHHGGLAWQGAFVGGFLSGLFFLKKEKIPVWKFIDIVIPYVALGHAIGRLGCFFNGCCHGRVSSWGIYFPVLEAKVIPTQIYMSLAQCLIFFLLKWQSQRPHRDGQIFIFYLLLSSTERFVMEFFRWNEQLFWGLSVFQYVCIFFFVIAIFLHQKIKQN